VSCEAFDRGIKAEGNRIASVARVLFKDSPDSLLKLLNKKDISLLSTIEHDPVTEDAIFFDGFLSMQGGPPLANSTFKKEVPLEAWWNQLIFTWDGHKFWRRNLILNAANKDGGAHVDKALPFSWVGLREKYWHRNVIDPQTGESRSVPITDTILDALRQIGYELLNSPQLLELAK
jgi:hypothetical protein